MMKAKSNSRRHLWVGAGCAQRTGSRGGIIIVKQENISFDLIELNCS